MSALDRFRLTDKVAIVTGSGRGIGASIATTFADAGADLVIAARTQEQLDKVAAQVAESGRRAIPVATDLNELENLEALVDRAVEEFGRVDVVVNNVGGSMPRPLMDTSAGFLERSFHFNVTTAFALTKKAVPELLKSNGSVVNISSAISRLRDRGFVGYGTAKAGLSHLTRLMAADLSPKVRVNGIAVGSVATSALEVVTSNDEIRETMEERIPLRRLGEPEDIALAALWLASPAGSWVTGKIIEVDGGLEEPNLEMGIPDL
jgi:7-alpha-hydroxysteroid dehydrogenase